jgi:hypothetical protein
VTKDELLRIAPELVAALIKDGVQQERQRCIAWLEAASYYHSEAEVAATVKTGKPFNPVEANELLPPVEDARDALVEAFEGKQQPEVIEAATDRYEMATARLSG